MVDRVSREPMGPGENILFQNAENLFAGWRKVSVSVTPANIWGAISHMEAGGFNRPGDAPIVWGLARSGISAGSPTAMDITQRAWTQKGRDGQAWDADPYFASAMGSSTPTGQGQTSQGGEPWRDLLGRDKQQILDTTDFETADAARAAGVQFDAPDGTANLFNVIKGTSRWLMAAFDAIPEGIDALGRAAGYVRSGELTPAQAVGGMFGFDREAGEYVGIPLFQYIRAGLEGERINMGQGWFAQGDVAVDVQTQLGLYDQETESFTDDDFGRMSAPSSPTASQGGVLVEGLGGKTYLARDLDELKFLRTTVGRAALLSSLQGSSLEQETLGTPYGSFQEQIFDEAAVTRRNGSASGAYFSHSTGRVLGSVVADPGTVAFNVVSAPIDLGKQLVDLNLMGLAGRGANLINKANKFIGATNEAADLARGTNIMNRIVDAADVGARGRVVDDMVAGRVNSAMAVNALVRQADPDITLARATVDTLRTMGAKTNEPDLVERLISQTAAGNNLAARQWSAKRLAETQDPNMNVNEALDALQRAQSRPDVSVMEGNWGTAKLDGAGLTEVDAIFRQAESEVAELQNIFNKGKAWTIRDPETGRGMLTMDADLGRAAATLDNLANIEAAAKGSPIAAARDLLAHYDSWDEAFTRQGDDVVSIGARQHQRVQEARGSIEKLREIPSYDGGQAFFHGFADEAFSGGGSAGITPARPIPQNLESLDVPRGASFLNMYGPGFYTSNDVFDVTYGVAGYGSRGFGVGHVQWPSGTKPNLLHLEGPLSRNAVRGMAGGIRNVRAAYQTEIVKYWRDLLKKSEQNFDPSEVAILRTKKLSDEEVVAQMEVAGQRLGGPPPMSGLLEDLNNMLDYVAGGGKADELKRFLRSGSWSDLQNYRGAMGAFPESIDGVFDLFKRMMSNSGLMPDGLDVVYREMNKGIRDAGFDGMTHTGGMRMGGGHEHQVIIWLRPENLKVNPVSQRSHTRMQNLGATATDKRLLQSNENALERTLVPTAEAFDRAARSGLLDDYLNFDNMAPSGRSLSDIEEEVMELVGVGSGRGLGVRLSGGFRDHFKDLEGLRRLAARTDPTVDAVRSRMGNLLLKDHWATKRHLAKMLGDTDEATERVDEIVRVLRRMDGENLLAQGAHAVKPRINPERISEFLSGKGANALVDDLMNATTERQIMNILGPTIEHNGRLPRDVIEAFKAAETNAEVIEVFTKLNAGVFLESPHIGLLGKAAVAGNLGTLAGASAGALAGAAQQAELDASLPEIIGGGLSGAVLGALGGSALGSSAGYFFGKTTRRIEDVADALDMFLAGTRSTTASVLRARGLDMGLPQAGLGVPQQLNYAFGHSAIGRRLARSSGTRMNLNDPDDIYYKLHDYARQLGMTTDEQITVLSRKEQVVRKTKAGPKEGTQTVHESIVHSQYKTQDEIDAAIRELEGNGWKVTETVKMDDAFTQAGKMQANNPASAWRVLETFMKVVDANLAARGMPEEFRHILRDFAQKGQQEFLGTTGALGAPSAHAQAALAGRVHDLNKGARTEAELWSGHIDMPKPETVTRAVNQLDKMGHTVQLFTSAGVMGDAYRNVKAVMGGGDWTPITPALERNIAMRVARAATSTLWAPIVLLGRPFAFLGRVLGEDQARMTASGMESFFVHPWNYVSAIAANWQFFQRHGALRGVTSRSLIPDEIINAKTGKLDTDVLDEMGHWQVSEDVRHALTIYDRKQARQQRLFGSTTWTTHRRGTQKYLEGLTTEFRQLILDPMTRHLAREARSGGDPIEATMRWLYGNSDGQRVMADWARQFHTADEAKLAQTPDELRAFLQDQYARLHLKTGGDWVFKAGNSVITSHGMPVDSATAISNGWDQLEDGYTIIRQGDDDLMGIVGSGEMKNVSLLDEDGVPYIEESLRVRDHLTEQKWQALKDELRGKNDSWEGKASRTTGIYEGPRFPEIVKGTKFDAAERANRGLMDVWDDAIDRFYDVVLGKPTRWFSRQPVMGQYYWERVGMLMPSMSPQMRQAYTAIAKKEGTWKYVNQIRRAFDDAGAASPGMMDEVGLIDLQAKAYAIERTRDILFDLHRQRNFVDGMRVVAPFMGPFVEAMEAWARVFQANPLYVWRRGTQVVDHLWNTTGIGDQTTPDPFNKGWFHVDPETGDEMFNYPIIGDWLAKLDASAQPGQPVQQVGGRARGLNVMFGSENMTQGETPEFMGFPVTALNPGAGPVFQAAASMMVKDPAARESEMFKFWFPFGTPENPAALLPYNLRKALEGNLGSGSAQELTRNTMVQFHAMIASGEAGGGGQYEFDLSDPGGVTAVMDEAQRRAIQHNRYEGLLRSILPTTMTPEILVDLPKEVPGFNTEGEITLNALADFTRKIMTEEGAQWLTTADGYRMSTEGDYEVATQYMNQLFGTDIFSAEFLSLPLTNRAYPRAYTESGLRYVQERSKMHDDLTSTASLIMPDYFEVTEGAEAEDYSFTAFDEAVRRGDASYYTKDEQEIQIQSRLLKLRERQIELEATQIWGPAEDLKGEEFAEVKNMRDAWVSNEKQRAAATFEAGSMPESQETKVFNELLQWETVNFSQYDLTPEELATVAAVQWYLQARNQALSMLQPMGVTKLSNVGASDQEKAMAQAVRNDLMRIVDNNLEYMGRVGTDPGNFVYIYEKYFLPELTQESDEYDPLDHLIRARREDAGLEVFSQMGVDYGSGFGRTVGVNPKTTVEGGMPGFEESGEVEAYEPELTYGS